MSKLSIGQHGIQVETHEKTNVMTPFNNVFLIVGVLALVLILYSQEIGIKYFGIGLILLYSVLWGIIYTCHSIKSPELLQSEVFRLEIHKMEMGMLEDKNALLEVEEIPRAKDDTCMLEDGCHE
ncbi:TPA: hypothetical protein CPT95_03515 [Candidatus Gastranaerophilales bacterium HUM_15]|jgi:hypothetical protein|nr:MAG TPA: hypothetical protein CPT95_03515 [Candidatus Gastranaerophilales bacterium HUM_15]DAR64294.1 MAG TPA: hypothetical protein [Caudoviricetes sp.]